MATGISWLCYFKALQLGEVAKVASINKLSIVLAVALASLFLHEAVSIKVIIGCILISVGTLFML